MGDASNSRDISMSEWLVLVLGAIASGAIVVLELCFGTWLVWHEIFPLPAKWIGAVIGLIATVAGPFAIIRCLVAANRSAHPLTATIKSMERAGGVVGALSLLIIMTMQ